MAFDDYLRPANREIFRLRSRRNSIPGPLRRRNFFPAIPARAGMTVIGWVSSASFGKLNPFHITQNEDYSWAVGGRIVS